jgi:hypothetical protein
VGGHRRLTLAAGAVFLALAGFLQYKLPGNVPGEHDTPVELAQRLLVAAYLTWIAATGAKMYRKTASRAVYTGDTNRSQLSNPTYAGFRPSIDYANIQPKITPDG